MEATRKPDRKAVRALAEMHSAELRAVAEAGGNPHQKSLDQKDQIYEFIETLSIEEKTAFLNMYSEEAEACTKQMVDGTHVALAKAEAESNSAQAVVGIIGLVVLLVILNLIFN
jgi:hypothetical protein